MTRKFLLDAAERTVATFVESFVGLLVLSGTLDISTASKAATAGVIAALTVVKSVAAKFLTGDQSASAVPSVAAATPTTP